MSMRFLVLPLALFVFGFIGNVGAQAPASGHEALPATVIDLRSGECPIMGGKPKPDVALMHAGKVYHFCCPSCFDEFRKDPVAAIARIKNPTEVELRVTNAGGACPVSGKPAKADVFLVREDSITFYCCPNCLGKDVPAPAPAPAAATSDAGSVKPVAPSSGTSSGAASRAAEPPVKPGAVCGPDGSCK